MSDETTDEGNVKGKETDISKEEPDKPLSPIQEVNKNYEELKTANDKVEAELLRKEELKAKIALGGQSDAGQERVKTPEELEKEKANDRIMKIGKAVGAEWAKPKD